jgi:hypothetical protein
MSDRAAGAEDVHMTRPSDLLTGDPALRRAPMPVNAPPVGPARARRIRLLALREQLAGPLELDVDAVAGAIARRAEFTRALAAELTSEESRAA